MFIKQPIIKLAPYDKARNFYIPNYVTNFASGMDIKASLDTPMVFLPLERRKVPTNLKLEIPPTVIASKNSILTTIEEEIGFYLELQIRAKSGYSYKKGLTLTNGVGTIDSDYRGEIYVSMTNITHNRVTIINGEDIAQIVLVPYLRFAWELTDEFSETERGEAGFDDMTAKARGLVKPNMIV